MNRAQRAWRVVRHQHQRGEREAQQDAEKQDLKRRVLRAKKLDNCVVAGEYRETGQCKGNAFKV